MKLKFLPRGSKQRIQPTNAIAWKSLPFTLVLVLSCSSAFAQDITELLQLLKDKGILNEVEFKRFSQRQKIQRESSREEVKFRAAEVAKEEIKAAAKDEVKGSFRDAFRSNPAIRSIRFRFGGVQNSTIAILEAMTP